MSFGHKMPIKLEHVTVVSLSWNLECGTFHPVAT